MADTAEAQRQRQAPGHWVLSGWGWRGLGVFLFLLCQIDHALTQWSVPLLALIGMLAVGRGEFAGEPSLIAAEWAALGFLAAVVVTSFSGVDSQRSLQLNSALVPAVLMYALVRNTRFTPLVWGFVVLILSYWVRLVWGGSQTPGDDPAEWIHRATAPWLVVPNDWCWTVMVLPWLWWRDTGVPRWVAAVLTVLIIGTAVWLQSRSAVLCAVVAAGALGLVLTRQRARRWLKPALLAAAGLGVLLLVVDGLNGFVFSAKFARVLDTRLALWWAALQVFWQAPWTGVGPHNFVHVYQAYLPQPGGVLPVDSRLTPWPHQLPLEILAEMGLLGAAAAAVWCYTVVRQYMKLPSDSVITLALTAVLAAFVFAAFVESSLLRIWTWVVLAAILANVVQASLSQIPPASAQSRQTSSSLLNKNDKRLNQQ